jgi:hypothetical protein
MTVASCHETRSVRSGCFCYIALESKFTTREEFGRIRLVCGHQNNAVHDEEKESDADRNSHLVFR